MAPWPRVVLWAAAHGPPNSPNTTGIIVVGHANAVVISAQYSVGRAAVYKFAYGLSRDAARGYTAILFLFFPATVPSFQKLKTAKEIYFGTDYDNQRNGEIFKIAFINDM